MNKTNEKKHDVTSTKKETPCNENKSKTAATPSAKK